MDPHWGIMLIIWAFVEFVQFLRKRPYPGRMKTGAWWAAVLGTVSTVGLIKPQVYGANPWWAFLAALALNGGAVLLVYGLRSLVHKGWCYLRT